MIISNETAPPKKQFGFKAAARKLNYAVAIVLNVVALVVVWVIPFLDISFINDEFNDALPYLNVALIGMIVGYFVLLRYDPYRFRHGMQIGFSLLTILFTVGLLAHFPFDFDDNTFDDLIRLGLQINIFTFLVIIAMDAKRLFMGEQKAKAKKNKNLPADAQPR
jgi:cytochrome bd-type quinol oxidase subunit 2